MLQDLRYAIRMLLKSPGFTAVAVLTLALGIGANTAIFSVLDGLFVRFLPSPNPGRLVTIETVHPGGTDGIGGDNWEDWKAQNNVFDHMAYTHWTQDTLAAANFPGIGEAGRITGAMVSADFFPLFETRPLFGRWFSPDEYEWGRHPVVMLSYQLWRSRFGARPEVIGQSVMLSSHSYTVVGVMPPTFHFNEGYLCEYWIPFTFNSYGRRVVQFSGYASLKPGVSIELAQARLNELTKRMQKAYPETKSDWTPKLSLLRNKLFQEGRPMLLLFLVAVGVVLLIACANVANLLLARATARSREITVRRALGAGSGAVTRLLLTESLLLAITAALVGLLFAVWGIDILAAMTPAWLSLKSIVYIDQNVLAFTVGLSLLTGVLTGALPAFQASRTDINQTLKQSGPAAGAGIGHVRSLSVMVVSEVALSAALLVAAGLLSKSFVRLLQVNLGYRTEGILMVRLQLPIARYPVYSQAVSDFYDRLTQRVGSLPGAISAGAVDAIPMGGQLIGTLFAMEGRPLPPSESRENLAQIREATPSYFSTLAIPLRRGRYFSEQDRKGTEPVVVVNESFRQKFFPNEDPVGKRTRPLFLKEWLTIIGVVGDVRHSGVDIPEGPAVYLPQAQHPSNHMFLAVRTAGPPASLAGTVRREISALDSGLVPLQVRTMKDAVSESLAMPRQILILVGFFACVALFLAALGLAGVMWYSVSRRTHEIGVRMALGARQSDMLGLVLWRGLRLTLFGLGVGLALAFGVTRLLASLLFGVTPRDPLVFVAVPLVLAAVALLATYLPARRAMKVDPMGALRYE